MTRDRAQVSFAYGPVPNRPRTGTGLWPRDWGPQLEAVLVYTVIAL